MRQAYIGVDVGTSSTRAGIFDEAGNLLAAAKQPIRLWQEAGDIVEQSSADIWNACVTSVRAGGGGAPPPPRDRSAGWISRRWRC
jgi:D-ribulokinase